MPCLVAEDLLVLSFTKGMDIASDQSELMFSKLTKDYHLGDVRGKGTKNHVFCLNGSLVFSGNAHVLLIDD